MRLGAGTVSLSKFRISVCTHRSYNLYMHSWELQPLHAPLGVKTHHVLLSSLQTLPHRCSGIVV